MTALRFIVGTLIDLYILTYILRFILQIVRADFYNPFSQFVVQITNPLVLPLRRLVPSWRGVDLATLLLVVILEVAAVWVLLSLSGYALPNWIAVLYYALMRAAASVLRLYWLALIVYVLMSWMGPRTGHPLARILDALCEPLLRPVRRVIPPIGGLDLSALLVLILVQALLLTVRTPV